MSHARQRIREAIAAALNGLVTTGANVFPSRVRPLGKESAPSIFVYTIDENSEIETMGNAPIMRRDVLLAVEGRTQLGGNDDPEDLLDTIAAEVETALFYAIANDANLQALLRSLNLVGTKIDIQAPGENIVGSIRLDFRAEYRTAEGAPSVAI